MLKFAVFSVLAKDAKISFLFDIFGAKLTFPVHIYVISIVIIKKIYQVKCSSLIPKFHRGPWL